MQERIHGTPPRQEDSSGPVVKHCWVRDQRGRVPALLLEWRRTASEWQGRVLRPALENGAWVVVDEWLPAQRLERL
jgi:hypothetical protein